MNLVGLIFLAVAAAAAAAVLYFVIAFNVKRRQVAACAAEAGDDALERIYRLVEDLGDTPSTTFVLGKTNRSTPEVSSRISVPDELEEFAWKGRTYQIDADEDVVFRRIDSPGGEARFMGKDYRPIAVPRSQTKSGKFRNAFSPDKYYSASEDLRRALTALCPKYPMELLSYLVCSGRDSFEFDAEMQARIGASIAWVQSPEFPNCDECGRRMTLILQVPGTMLHPKRFHEGVFYLFGCKQHPDETKSVVQYY